MPAPPPGPSRAAAARTITAIGMLLGCAGAPSSSSGPGALSSGPIRVENELLAARMAELGRRSPTWRAGMDTLRATGFEVLIAEPAQVRKRVPGFEYYEAKHLGEVVPLRDATGTLTGAVVTVDLPRLRRLHKLTGLPESAFEADVDRILIHEIYGHVVPLAQTRRLSGGCPDPAPGKTAASSCAVQRENRIRAELGLERRTTYDIRGLAVGRALGAKGLAPVAPEEAP